MKHVKTANTFIRSGQTGSTREAVKGLSCAQLVEVNKDIQRADGTLSEPFLFRSAEAAGLESGYDRRRSERSRNCYDRARE